ncbi:MAG: ABC transporter ATP-binding protein [Treponema sp.]|jgi:ABC-type glutathione transport system ATPase component|nr:ABC transporter ATP-binding protein [Treponema sp.]
MLESGALLNIRNVSNTYRSRLPAALGGTKGRPVLRQVNLAIAPGELFGLVGESGCGKTTLGRCILGLIDYQGEILIRGLSRQRPSVLDIGRHIQAVFQDPALSLNPVKTVGWLLEEPLRARRLGTKAERRGRVDAALNLIGLDPSYKTRMVRELSGGQKQRVSIGCALMLEPELLIADEAVSALDVSVGAQIINLLQELHRALKLALLFISHDLNLVYYLCDRIAVMYQGRILETGSASALYHNARHPYTQDLVNSRPPLPASPSTVPDAEGCIYASRCRRRFGGCGSRPQEPRNIPGPGGQTHWAACERADGG